MTCKVQAVRQNINFIKTNDFLLKETQETGVFVEDFEIEGHFNNFPHTNQGSNYNYN